jgi:predicted short-subunit dehydrogenase-like oxidoreductase (DUF2520 family)
MKTINIIGAGRVGTTLGRCFTHTQTAHIQGVLSRSLETAQAACNFIGAGVACTLLADLPQADIYLITTPDDAIASVAQALSNHLSTPAILLHCSGNLASEVVRVSNHCTVASIHPIRSFANAALASAHYAGTLHAIEGDAAALAILKPLFENIGGQCFEIQATEKSQYHAGLVIANNYLTTLHYHATQLLMNAGLSEAAAKNINTEMMQQALQNLQQLPHAAALTGPLKRGDLNTVQKHLAVLKTTGAEKLYQALAQATLPLTEHEANFYNLLIKPF